MAIQTRLEDMQIGDKVICTHVVNPSDRLNASKQFQQLGTPSVFPLGTSNFNASTLSANSFYFIYVADDFKGQKILVADRNVAHSISWDQLNTMQFATGDGVQVDLKLENYNTYIRLLTGGTSSANTANSEWDKYIVNGPVGSDNAIWNWSGIYSWTSTTSNTSAQRAVRGSGSVTTHTRAITSDGGSNKGFRPVLVAESLADPVINKYLIQDGQEIKAYLNNVWSVVGASPATKAMFTEQGMDNIASIPVSEWKSSMKILRWSDSDQEQSLSVSVAKSLYDGIEKAYKGQGIIETEMEVLQDGRTSLILHADHSECTFQYSLTNGETWYTCSIEEMIDITTQEGNELVIRVTLPTSTATVKGLSYAWA